MNTQHVTVDLTKAPTYAQMITIGQGDASGTTIVADVYDSGQAATLTGMTARFCMRLPNDGGYVRDAGCTVSGNQITYVVDESKCASVSGRADECYFEILNGAGTVKYSTSRFRVMVLRAADSGTDAARTWDADFDVWKASKDNLIGATINAANAAVDGMRDDVDGIVAQADDAIDRAEAAIDAMGDVSELAVPLMSADIRGGAKLGRGLAVEDGALSVQLDAESDGSEAGPIVELTARGHAEQFSTTGKNLLPKHNATSWTANGVTFTVNADGSVTASGTSDSGKMYYYTYLTLMDTEDVSFAKGQTVTFSTHGANLANFRTHVLYNTDSNPSFVELSAPFTDTLTAAMPADLKHLIVRLVAYAGGTATSGTIYPQLELGSTATSYEPYTGGIPSPNPDYPQEVEVARGRNLLDVENLTWVKGSYINASGEVSTSAGTDYMYEQEYVGVNGDERYSISLNKLSSANAVISIAFYDSSKTFISRILVSAATTSTGSMGGTATAPSNAAYARVSIPKDASDIQLEKSPITPYVPYGNVGLEVQGKNLMRLSLDELKLINTGGTWTDNKWTANGVTFTLNMLNNGLVDSITVSGTPTALTFFLLTPRFSWFMSLGSSYTASGCGSSSASPYVQLINVVSQSGIANPFNGRISVSYTDESTQGNYGFVIRINANAGAINSVTFRPQLELGSVATPYEPYTHTTTPIPLPSTGFAAALPDGTHDELTIDAAGRVTWVQRVGKVTFDGTEAFSLANTATYQQIWTTARVSGALSASYYRNILVTHFGTYAGRAVNKAMLDNKNFNMHFAPNTFARVSDFKTWLQSNPVTVYYPLATPVTEEMGYVDLPEIPEGVTISIPELDDLGVKYCVDGVASTLAHQYYERARSEYEDRIAALEEAVAEIIAG